MAADPTDQETAPQHREETCGALPHSGHGEAKTANAARRVWHKFADALQQSGNRPPWWTQHLMTHFRLR